MGRIAGAARSGYAVAVAKRPASKPKAPREVEVKPPTRPQIPPAPRPLPLAGLIAQDRAVSRLRAAVQSGRIHHAWVLHAPTGVGNFTTALAFAALIPGPTAG